MKTKQSQLLCQGAIIAALYVALTWLAALFHLDKGVIQLRISEALCVLPVFLPAAVPGLTLGCFLSNLFFGAVPLDVVFGSLATLLGAIGTRALRKRPLLALLPPILSNTLIVPWILRFGYGAPDAIWIMVLTVGAGELLSVGVLGGALWAALRNRLSGLVRQEQ